MLSQKSGIQLTFEQYKFEMYGSTYIQICFNKYSTENVFSLTYDFNNIFSLASLLLEYSR